MFGSSITFCIELTIEDLHEHVQTTREVTWFHIDPASSSPTLIITSWSNQLICWGPIDPYLQLLIHCILLWGRDERTTDDKYW